MSGGHFDYEQYRIQQAADDLNNYIRKIVEDEFEDYKPEYSEKTLARFKQCALELERVSRMLHHIDYLICCDYGEDSFTKAWQDDIDPPKV